ncbi:MAG: glucose-6-phosphate isomerase, partial [Pseudonocardiales bacterium]|nr:glucose-6-phosphate isomerase [Pseudonocardiales bacterium]
MSSVQLRIVDPDLADEARRIATGLADDKVASGIAAKDATLWGPDAESEASVRLNWVDLGTSSRPLVAQV